MDGKRGVRAEGTDGTDFAHRQQIDDRYAKLSSAKGFISTTGQITIAAGLYAFLVSFIEPNVIGIDTGIVGPILLAGLSLIIYLLSSKVASSVVDVGIVALHKLLCNIMFLSAIGIIGGIIYELTQGKVEHYLIYPSIIIFLFMILVSRASVRTDDEIIEALETKKGGKGKH